MTSPPLHDDMLSDEWHGMVNNSDFRKLTSDTCIGFSEGSQANDAACSSSPGKYSCILLIFLIHTHCDLLIEGPSSHIVHSQRMDRHRDYNSPSEDSDPDRSSEDPTSDISDRPRRTIKVTERAR
jgi:hypothetical protein